MGQLFTSTNILRAYVCEQCRYNEIIVSVCASVVAFLCLSVTRRLIILNAVFRIPIRLFINSQRIQLFINQFLFWTERRVKHFNSIKTVGKTIRYSHTMSNQCRNCGRDVNNNYAPYANAYGSSNNAKMDKSSASKGSTASAGSTTQLTAKVMFGTVGAIKELREKEQAEKNNAARASRRQ